MLYAVKKCFSLTLFVGKKCSWYCNSTCISSWSDPDVLVISIFSFVCLFFPIQCNFRFVLICSISNCLIHSPFWSVFLVRRICDPAMFSSCFLCQYSPSFTHMEDYYQFVKSWSVFKRKRKNSKDIVQTEALFLFLYNRYLAPPIGKLLIITV